MPPVGKLKRRGLLIWGGLSLSRLSRSQGSRITTRSTDMTFAELMDRVRAAYTQDLANAIRGRQPSLCEPVLRRSDGSPAIDHELGTPVRVDFLDSNGASVSVDSKEKIQFDEFSFDLNRTTVAVAPFAWDWLALEIQGDVQTVEAICKHWFLRWFDANDQREPGREGLLGVVHFMGNPVPKDDAIFMRIDLGSAAASSLDDLLYALSDASVSRVRLSS